MKRFYAAVLGIVVCLSANRSMGYNKLCYESYEYNRPFNNKEMLFKKADYVYSDTEGNRRCHVQLSPLDRKKIRKSLLEYPVDTVVTPEFIKLFLNKRRPHDKMVGWVLQDFMIRYLDAPVAIGQVLKELGLDIK